MFGRSGLEGSFCRKGRGRTSFSAVYVVMGRMRFAYEKSTV
jgi:hypothetical protein